MCINNTLKGDYHVFKRVKSLSGGELTRLKLAKLMQQDINLLVLDEPTNHLDIDSREMLEETLSEFKGTVIFISHDRYFINKVASRIVELQDGQLKNYTGDYDDYKRQKARVAPAVSAPRPTTRTGPASHDRNRRAANQLRKMERRMTDIEAEIETLEAKSAELESAIGEHAFDHVKLAELYKAKDEIRHRINALMEEWIDLEAAVHSG